MIMTEGEMIKKECFMFLFNLVDRSNESHLQLLNKLNVITIISKNFGNH